MRAFDHGTLIDGRPYLVLEYIEGPSLRDVIHERGSLPPHEMLAILEPLCDALTQAHAEPGTAMSKILGHDARSPRPVLLDFGLVKPFPMPKGRARRRRDVGTPAAMAPEQMKGQPVTAVTDVYAIGLLAYHMLTGVPAFGGSPGVVQSYMQIHGPRPRPSSKSDIDPAIDEPIVRALAPDPSGRNASPRELCDALREIIQPSGISTEQEVVTLYVEETRCALAATLAAQVGMTIAMSAPDSLIAVGPRLDLVETPSRLEDIARAAKVAVNEPRDDLRRGSDGPALDVEGWAPYPLEGGLWITPTLL